MLECLKSNLEEFNSLENYITRFSDNKFYSTFYFNEDKLPCKKEVFINGMTLKYSIFTHEDKLKFAIMFKFKEDNSIIIGRVYDYERETDKEHLEMLLFQNEIPICLTKYCKLTSSFCIENDFKQGIKEYILNKRKPYKYKSLNLEIKELWYNS